MTTLEQMMVAERLLGGGRDRNESQIRQDLVRLFDFLEVDSVVEFATPNGFCDLILPRHRVIIEVKRVGLAADPNKPQSKERNETPREQMERYMYSQIESDLEWTSPDDDSFQDRPWTGIVTDGQTWHAWSYEHTTAPTPQSIKAGTFTSAEALITWIRGIVGDPLNTKPWVPKDFPKQLSTHQQSLREIYFSLRGRKEISAKTKFSLWLEMLKTSGMAPSKQEAEVGLFIRHSLLITIARGVIHTLAHPTTTPNPEEILNDGFVAWTVNTERGKDWAQGVLDEIHQYDWRLQYGDLLRPVYEELIEADERKDFGEVYTPDWLAAMIVEEVLDDDWCERAVHAALEAGSGVTLEGIGVLDPACGSGSFLYHACRKISRTATLQLKSMPKVQKAGAIAKLVNGIDVHPVAAEVARATVLRALPAEPPDGEHAIQIAQGDSLMAHGDPKHGLFSHSKTTLRITTPKGREIYIPKSFVSGASLVKNMRLLVEVAANRSPLPDYLYKNLPESDHNLLEAAKTRLEKVIEEEGDSVWAWYVVNIAGPVLLSERKIDRIVANPPWVRMAQIQVQARKRDLENMAVDEELWVGGTQAPHFDVAQLFIKRCRELYMKNVASDKAGWLVKRSALTGGNWEKLRNWHKDVLEQTLNLEELQPFGGGDAQKCCVLFDQLSCSVIASSNHQNIRVGYKDQRPSACMGWEAAKELLMFSREPERAPRSPSEYIDRNGEALFRQGATITPKVLVVVDEVERKIGGHLLVRTEPSMHKPWRSVSAQKGKVPLEWVQLVYVSDDVYPFGTSVDPRKAIIPLSEDGTLEQNPESKSEFWRKLDEIYMEHCGKGNSTPKSLLSQIDFNSKLARQLPLDSNSNKHTVVHVRAGDIMRASRVSKATLIDASLHRLAVDSPEEAAYLVGILNTPALNKAYVDARNSGRDFVNHIWTRVPIPRYDGKIAAHRQIAHIAMEAESLVEKFIEDYEPKRSKSQVGISRAIRGYLSEWSISDRLNEAAANILPEHVSQQDE